MKKLSKIASSVSIEDMGEEFTVTSDMAVRLCDAVLGGDLPADALQTIGFTLMASDRFSWDSDCDDVLAEVIADWSAPEVNYPLTRENVEHFRRWLLRTEPYPPRPSAVETTGEIISVVQKQAKHKWWKRSWPNLHVIEG